jgi:hypothetical protein
LGKLKGTDQFGDLEVDGRIILKWILKKQGMRVYTEFIWLKIRTSDGVL